MSDDDCVDLLRWALPRLGLRWTGFRALRGQVCKRIRRRLAQLGVADLAAYRARLLADPEEWKVLDRLCVITISRFYRDRGVWDALRDEVLPAIAEGAVAAGEDELRCWSLGCASGEEPYTLSILWSLGLAHRFPGLRLRVLATDVDDAVLRRARAAVYPAASLEELSAAWREEAFDREGELLRLRERFRRPVEIREEDVRRTLPEERFDLVLCRNVVFTYFDEAVQRETLERLLTRLTARAALVLGRHERLPTGAPLRPWRPALGIYRRA